MRSAGAAVFDEVGGMPMEELGTFRCGCWVNFLLSAVRAGTLLFAAAENIVAAFGLTTVNHAVHLL